jgi:hypothetical protein
MYSPKIREDLIPKIYRAAKSAKIAMTKWVNQVIEEALPTETEENGRETNARILERKENMKENESEKGCDQQ